MHHVKCQAGWNPRWNQDYQERDTPDVQWLRLHTPEAGALGSIHGQGTRSHMLRWRWKVLYDATKTQHSQIHTYIHIYTYTKYIYTCCCCKVASVVSNSVRPHRRQPTRLPRPWDSPGKNTGVGCHFLLQCMKVKRESEVAQWCLTLSDPMDYSLPGSSIHGIFQARVLEGFSLLVRKSDCFPLSFNIWFFSYKSSSFLSPLWYSWKFILIFFKKCSV